MNPRCLWQLNTLFIHAIHLVWNKNHFLSFILIFHSLQSCTKAHMCSGKQKRSYKLTLQKLVIVAELLKGIFNATHLVAQGKYLHNANQSIMSIMEMKVTHIERGSVTGTLLDKTALFNWLQLSFLRPLSLFQLATIADRIEYVFPVLGGFHALRGVINSVNSILCVNPLIQKVLTLNISMTETEWNLNCDPLCSSRLSRSPVLRF